MITIQEEIDWIIAERKKVMPSTAVITRHDMLLNADNLLQPGEPSPVEQIEHDKLRLLNQRNRLLNLKEADQAERIAREQRLKGKSGGNRDPFARIRGNRVEETKDEAPTPEEKLASPVLSDSRRSSLPAAGTFDESYADIDIDIDI
jgi:hypothetical protein